MKFSEELVWRNSIKDKTFTNVSYLDSSHTLYLGTDGTADSLTVGHLAWLVLLMRFLANGYKVFVLVGGATTMVGDPSERADERELKTIEEIRHNTESIKQQVESVFKLNNIKEKVEFVNNYDWFKDIKLLDFLRDTGKLFNVSDLVSRDFVQQRIDETGNGISFAEFSYTLIQGYDFWHLHKYHGIDLQIGGSDQWGNLLSGVGLIRKKENTEVNAMTIPLIINRSTGVKFGKSEAGAVWLDAKKTSPTDFYQFFINTNDDDVEYLMKAYTFISPEDLDMLITKHNTDPSKRLAQKELAYQVTLMVHGQEQTEIAVKITDILTGKVNLNEVNKVEAELLKNNFNISNHKPGDSILDILVETKLCSSKTEARKLLNNDSISINFKKVSEEFLTEENFVNGILLLKKGKAFKDTVVVSLV